MCDKIACCVITCFGVFTIHFKYIPSRCPHTICRNVNKKQSFSFDLCPRACPQSGTQYATFPLFIELDVIA